MTTIKTKINGQDFSITVDDGLTIEFADGELFVSGQPKAAPYSYEQLAQMPYCGVPLAGQPGGNVWISPHYNQYKNNL